jgi:3-hydroxyisobutyrate dehydrogenase
VVLTMLADSGAVIESMRAALPCVGEDSTWLQMSTIGEAGTERCIQLAQEQRITLVDAPVLGTKQPAEEGKLVILASGPGEVRDFLQPIFDAIGQKTMWIGEAGAGTRLKIVTNSWVLTVVEAAAEAIALAEALGLDPSLLFDAIEGGSLDLPYLRIKGKAMLERNFEPSFRLELAAKDAGLIEESAKRHDLDLPMFSAIRARMAEGAKEHGDEDMSATYLTSAPAAI